MPKTITYDQVIIDRIEILRDDQGNALVRVSWAVSGVGAPSYGGVRDITADLTATQRAAAAAMLARASGLIATVEGI